MALGRAACRHVGMGQLPAGFVFHLSLRHNYSQSLVEIDSNAVAQVQVPH
jgi:hypothetical protein